MSKTGLSKAGLERMHRVLQGYVERAEMPGLVALVSRYDDVHVEVLGKLSFRREDPMERDTVFRIASITKPVAAVGAMILVEECKFRLDDAVDRWLPELANRRVLRSISSQLDDTVPAARAITIRDLLTYCMGFGSVMARAGTYPIQQPIRELAIGGDRPLLPTDYPPPDEWLRRLGSLPLMAQPGERWMYQVSGDVLGTLIARASGQSLGKFLREHIFDPLGMRNTGFQVPADQLQRLPGIYCFNRKKGALDLYEDETRSAWAQAPAFEAAGGGLVSTVDDYFAFCHMMLNKGMHGREQILSRASVELMTSDQVSKEQRAGSELFLESHSSWGFGVAVDIARKEIYHNPGRFGWTGGYGTTAYTDPAEGMIGILFTQRMMDSPDPPHIFTDYWTTAYAAME